MNEAQTRLNKMSCKTIWMSPLYNGFEAMLRIRNNKMTKYMRLLALLLAVLPIAGFADVYDTIQVNHTELHVDIRDFKHHTLRGKAMLEVVSKMDNVRFVPLYLLNMNIDSVWVNDIYTPDVVYNDTLLRIPTPTLQSNEKALITLAYHGVPYGTDFGGFCWFDDERMAHNMGISLHDIPHSIGKAWYPCVDDLRSRSTFEAYYLTSADRKAIGNGLLVDCTTQPDGSLLWHWSQRQAIQDYLFNVAVGDYQLVHFDYTNASRTIPVDAYVTPHEVENAKQAFSLVPDIMAVMEKRFGPYPFDRVGYVTVNSPLGAMEHVSNICVDRNPEPTYDYLTTVIHELVHGWFGNNVTCSTYGDMWLNEGITTYMVEVVLEELFPEDWLRYYQRDEDLYVADLDSTSPSYHPLANTPETDTYGGISYLKGGWVIRQLRHLLGDDLFFRGMRKYLENYSFKNASTEEFKSSLEVTTGHNLDLFFQEYVYK